MARSRVPASWIIVGIVLLTVLGSILLTYQDMPGQRQSATAIAHLTLTASGRPEDTPASSPPPTPTAMLTVASPTLPVSPTITNTPTPTVQVTPSPTSSPTPSSTEICRPPEDWQVYVVKKDDTIDALASQHGVSVQALMEANCLTEKTIRPEQRLYVPPPEATPTSTRVPVPCDHPPAHWRLYTVQRGDTLSILAWRHRTTVYEIMRANCLDSYIIRVGQRLYLPPLPPTPPPTIPPTQPPPTWPPPTHTPTEQPPTTEPPTQPPPTSPPTTEPPTQPPPTQPPPTSPLPTQPPPTSPPQSTEPPPTDSL